MIKKNQSSSKRLNWPTFISLYHLHLGPHYPFCIINYKANSTSSMEILPSFEVLVEIIFFSTQQWHWVWRVDKRQTMTFDGGMFTESTVEVDIRSYLFVWGSLVCSILKLEDEFSLTREIWCKMDFWKWSYLKSSWRWKWLKSEEKYLFLLL